MSIERSIFSSLHLHMYDIPKRKINNVYFHHTVINYIHTITSVPLISLVPILICNHVLASAVHTVTYNDSVNYNGHICIQCILTASIYAYLYLL